MGDFKTYKPGMKFLKYLRHVAVPLNELLINYKLNNKWKDPHFNFTNIITEEGVCITANLLKPSELFQESVLESANNYYTHNQSSRYWSMERGYLKEAPLEDSYPVRLFNSGPNTGLELHLRLHDDDLDHLCGGGLQGFKIILHSPDELPQASDAHFHLSLDNAATLSVKPRVMTSSDGLKDYPPARQAC